VFLRVFDLPAHGLANGLTRGRPIMGLVGMSWCKVRHYDGRGVVTCKGIAEGECIR
jgi:hypothetical protein